MGTARRGQAGLFKGTSRRRKAPATSRLALSGIAYMWDLASDRLSWGPGACEALGLLPEDLPTTGQAFAQMVEPGSGLSRPEAIAGDGAPEGAYDLRFGLRFGPDQVVMVQDSGRWYPDTQDRPSFVRGQLRASPQSSTRDLLPAIVAARSDLLCGIQNDINEALRVSHTCTLIVGSFEDDEVDGVEGIARSLRSMMRSPDHFTALGRNRFAVTLTCCPASEAVSAMMRLRGLLSGHPAARALHLGAACSPDHTFQAMKLLRFAEQALGLAIEHGETVRLHTLRHAAAASDPERMSMDLIEALNERRIALACRPVVDAQSRAPALVQACASLTSRAGRPAPLGPLPQGPEANLPLLVDARLLELASEHLARNPEDRLVLPVTGQTLQDAEWLPMLAAHLGARPGIESQLILEIPEAALAQSRIVRGRLDAMKALGIGLALGGFGAGHVAPAQLRHMPFDLLKIDGIFIQPLRRSTDDRLHVRTLVDMAQQIGVATVAEWVDEPDTARMLTSWGVDYLQGGLFGDLAPAVELPSLAQMASRA